jgi:hypothetical protein
VDVFLQFVIYVIPVLKVVFCNYVLHNDGKDLTISFGLVKMIAIYFFKQLSVCCYWKQSILKEESVLW